MTILVVGGSGATGIHLVKQLLEKGHTVKVIVRSTHKLKDFAEKYDNLKIILGSISDLSDRELEKYINNCDAIASCLGHNLSWKGMFGPPYRLVTDSVIKLCRVAKLINADRKTKFVLMNTAGNSNRDLNEQISFKQKLVIGLLRALLPPHVDNEKASDYLRLHEKTQNIEWVVVRPDNLINKDHVSEYNLHPSPIRSAIFNAGQTSRINVGNFMAELIVNDIVWDKWKMQMPVIYNSES